MLGLVLDVWLYVYDVQTGAKDDLGFMDASFSMLLTVEPTFKGALRKIVGPERFSLEHVTKLIFGGLFFKLSIRNTGQKHLGL